MNHLTFVDAIRIEIQNRSHISISSEPGQIISTQNWAQTILGTIESLELSGALCGDTTELYEGLYNIIEDCDRAIAAISQPRGFEPVCGHFA